MVVSLLELMLKKKTLIFLKTINEIFRNIKQSTKKSLINKISMRLLGLEFKSDNKIKSKAMKYIVKKILVNYK